jgi:hypothetical protein
VHLLQRRFQRWPEPAAARQRRRDRAEQGGPLLRLAHEQPLRQGCVHEKVAGLAVEAFLESCPRSPDVRVYMRGRTADAVVGVDVKPLGGAAAAKPVVIALAKSVAARIK